MYCSIHALTGSSSSDKNNLIFEEVLLEDRVIVYVDAIEAVSEGGFCCVKVLMELCALARVVPDM